MDYSLNKIAKELGLSKTTVSLVLSGKARKNRISEEIAYFEDVPVFTTFY